MGYRQDMSSSTFGVVDKTGSQTKRRARSPRASEPRTVPRRSSPYTRPVKQEALMSQWPAFVYSSAHDK